MTNPSPRQPGRYSPFRHLGAVIRKEEVLHLTVFLTRRCNARCGFCFYLSGEEQATAREPELTLTELTKISLGVGKLLWLAFSGGEIFLRQDLLEIVQQFYQQNQPAIILLPTNGLLSEVILAQTRAILESCPRSTVVVKISLDGAAETHDRLRGVAGAHARAMATYQLLTPLLAQYGNFELGINSVLCAANQAEMAETIAWVGELDQLGTHTVSLIRGRVRDQELKEVAPETYRQVAELLEERLKGEKNRSYRFGGARLKAAQDILQRRLIHRTMLEKRRLLPCYAGRLALVITENGDLFPCESFELKLGNLREHDFDLPQALATEQGAGILAGIARRQCFCTHECSFLLNILFNPRLYPQLLLEYLQLARVFHEPFWKR